MGKDADPAKDSSPSEQEHADHAANGESKGTPDSGRHQSETAVHRQNGHHPPAKP